MSADSVESTDGIDDWVSAAVNNAKLKTHKFLLPVHFLATLMDQPVNVAVLSTMSNVDLLKLDNDIFDFSTTMVLDDLYYGAYVGPVSEEIDEFFLQSHKMAEYMNEDRLFIYHILMALTYDPTVGHIMKNNHVDKESIKSAINSIIIENSATYHPRVSKNSKNNVKHNKGNKAETNNSDSETVNIDTYGVDLTALAAAGKMSNIIGRDNEIRTIIKTLLRSTKNNPLIIGEPGVGKTAIIEGLAHRIVNDDVPNALKNTSLYRLDLTNLVSGAKMQGETEERFQKVIKEVQNSDGGIILFIDEIHTMTDSVANVLKQVLSRGNMFIIGATTVDEYRNHIEVEPALDRRFQKINVAAPTVDETITILRGIVGNFQKFHKVQIDDDALVAAVTLSDRYVADRMLPDKAIDIIDEAAAKMRMELDSEPVAIDSLNRQLKRVSMEEIALSNFDTPESQVALNVLLKNKNKIESALLELSAQWTAEKDLRSRAEILREEIDLLEIEENRLIDAGDLAEASKVKYDEITKKVAELEKVEMTSYAVAPLVPHSIGSNEVAKIVESWTGVPIGNILESESKKLIRMESAIGERLIGQKEAVKAVSNAIRRSRAGVADPNRPTGSFLFLGTSGSGKTLLCKALAGFLFDDESAIVRIDMSEFSEKHSVARLIGAPPGYVGYEAGGQLTDAVRDKPYSVVLFDEVEKAHPEIFDILLQVLDDGHLTDSKGRTVNFKNTIIVLTSNIGSNFLVQDDIDNKTKRSLVMDTVKSKFRPEFLNRLDEMVVFEPFSKSELGLIVNLEVSQFTKRLDDKRITFDVQASAREWLSENGYDPKYGARPLRRLIQDEIGNKVSLLLLSGEVDNDDIVTVSHDQEGDNEELILTVEKREWQQNDIN